MKSEAEFAFLMFIGCINKRFLLIKILFSINCLLRTIVILVVLFRVGFFTILVDDHWRLLCLHIFYPWRCIMTIVIYVDTYLRFYSGTFITILDEMGCVHWGFNVSIILNAFIVFFKDLYFGLLFLQLFEDLILFHRLMVL